MPKNENVIFMAAKEPSSGGQEDIYVFTIFYIVVNNFFLCYRYQGCPPYSKYRIDYVRACVKDLTISVKKFIPMY